MTLTTAQRRALMEYELRSRTGVEVLGWVHPDTIHSTVRTAEKLRAMGYLERAHRTYLYRITAAGRHALEEQP